MKKYLAVTLASLLLMGCSSKQLYQAGQGVKKSECINQAITQAELDNCKRDEGLSYEDYQKERSEVVKK